MGAPKVLFQHIPKTAGSTLGLALSRLFDPCEVWEPKNPYDEAHQALISHICHGTGNDYEIGTDANDSYTHHLRALEPAALARLRLLQGHFFYGLHEHLPQPARSVTMLRDPVDRVLSLYQYRVTHHGVTLTLAEYVRTKRDPSYSNDQTKRLSGSRTQGDIRWDPVTDDMLERAKYNLEQNFVVGTLERFDESVVLIQNALDRKPLVYRTTNVAAKRPRVEELPQALVAEIKRDNAFDIELYDFAASLVDKQIGSLDIDFERELRAVRLANRKEEVVEAARTWRKQARAAAGRLKRAVTSKR